MTDANWYPDPSGAQQLRWFDGAAWTEHTQALPPVAAQPKGPPQPPLLQAPVQQKPAAAQYPQHEERKPLPALPVGKRRITKVHLICGGSAALLGLVRSLHSETSPFSSSGFIAVCTLALILGSIGLQVWRGRTAVKAVATERGMTWTMQTSILNTDYKAMGASIKPSRPSPLVPTLMASDGQRLLFLPSMQRRGLRSAGGRMRPFQVSLGAVIDVGGCVVSDGQFNYNGVRLTVALPDGSKVPLRLTIANGKQAAALACGPLGQFFAPA